MSRSGVPAALGAYIFWGLAPIYFKLLVAVSPLEIIAHRLLWSIPVLAGFLLWRDGMSFWRRMLLPPRTVALLFVTGSLVVGNWLVFVYAVVSGHILASSLGYFITPLVNFLLGFLFLHERLNRVQMGAVVIAAAGTAYLGWFLGATPWLSLSLAFSFGFYGLLRKKLAVGPTIGLLWETLLLSPVAVAFVAWSLQRGTLQFGRGDLPLDLLLLLAGLVTVLPLLAFTVAVRRLSLTAIGFFQYIAPSMTFLLSVLVYGESFTQGHAVAFACIWCALAMVSAEQLYRAGRARRAGASRGAGGREVILVHGLWFGAWSLGLLGWRLRKAGFAPRYFRYRTTRGTIGEHAGALRGFVGEPGDRPPHFVAHSMGGLVTLTLLTEDGDRPSGRVVLLGSPLRGSGAARRSARLPGGRLLIGAPHAGLVTGIASLPPGREVGMIAGSRGFGLGLLVGAGGGPGDGTVSIAETRADGLRGHLALPVTHTGLLFSRTVADRTIGFLRTGSFDGSP